MAEADGCKMYFVTLIALFTHRLISQLGAGELSIIFIQQLRLRDVPRYALLSEASRASRSTANVFVLHEFHCVIIQTLQQVIGRNFMVTM